MAGDPIVVFDRGLLRRRRDTVGTPDRERAFLLDAAGDSFGERLRDVRRPFADVLDLGCTDDRLAEFLRDGKGMRTLVHCDIARRRLLAAPGLKVVGDEEALPFRPACFDLVLSALVLQWVNDLPGALAQIRAALRPDGLFLAAVLGGQTLQELRHCLADAELEVNGGVSPRVSPFLDVRDAGALLQRAGFALPVVDSDVLTVWYRDVMTLFADLRALGAANAVVERRRAFSGRRLFARAHALYHERHADKEGRVPVTVQVIYLTGWAPDASQPRPLARGSARISLHDVLSVPPSPAADRRG